VKTVVHTLSEAFFGGPCTAFTERFITHTHSVVCFTFIMLWFSTRL